MTNNIEVELLNYTQNPIDTIYTAMRTCYSDKNPSEIWHECKNTPIENKKKLIEKVIKSGHTSTIECISLTFALNNIDRNISHQLVRKRIASYSQQSLRYVDVTKKYSPEFLKSSLDNEEQGIKIAKEYYTDVTSENYKHYINSLVMYSEAIQNGCKKEEARNYLCTNIRTNLVMSLNLRSFIDLCAHRLCTRAQKPIRLTVQKMVKELKKNDDFDFIYKYLEPKCVLNGNICTEDNSCGRCPTL